MANTLGYIGWEMDDLKHTPVAKHVQMAAESHLYRMECEPTHIYCHASQVALFDGMGYTVKSDMRGVNPGVFWIGVA